MNKLGNFFTFIKESPYFKSLPDIVIHAQDDKGFEDLYFNIDVPKYLLDKEIIKIEPVFNNSFFHVYVKK